MLVEEPDPVGGLYSSTCEVYMYSTNVHPKNPEPILAQPHQPHYSTSRTKVSKPYYQVPDSVLLLVFLFLLVLDLSSAELLEV